MFTDLKTVFYNKFALKKKKLKLNERKRQKDYFPLLNAKVFKSLTPKTMQYGNPGRPQALKCFLLSDIGILYIYNSTTVLSLVL